MSKRNTMGYKGYQGRGGGASGWLKALVYVLAILVVGGAGYLLAKRGEISLPTIEIQMPSSTQQPTEEEPVTTDPASSTSQTPAPTPTPTPVVELGDIQAVEVTVDQLLGGSAGELVQQAGCDALVVQVKDEQGRLQWPSQVALAQQLGAVSGQESLDQALAQLSQQGVYLVARVDCFRDQLLAVENPDQSLLMSQRGNRWYDYMGKSWVSPISWTVRNYTVQLCQELAQMGFDELVLDSAYFPDQGEIFALAELDNYPAQRTTPVETFWKELTAALQDTGVAVSAQVRGDSLADNGATTGMTPQMLETYAQRVWVNLSGADQTQVEQILTQAGLDAPRLLVSRSAGGQTLWD